MCPRTHKLDKPYRAHVIFVCSPRYLLQAKTGPKSMFDVFKKWSMAHHTFTSIKLTSAEVSSLSPATLQFLEEEEGNKATKVRSAC